MTKKKKFFWEGLGAQSFSIGSPKSFWHTLKLLEKLFRKNCIFGGKFFRENMLAQDDMEVKKKF
jgi:hypothetical protein